MVVPDQVLGLQQIGEGVQPYWVPSSADGVHLRLEPGENVLRAGRCRVKSSAGNWILPDDTTIVVTDRRIAFMSTDFDKGGGWVGFGAAGLAISVAANIVSKHRAAKRSAGLVAIGQLRHEWIDSVELRRERALLGPVTTYVYLTAPTVNGSVDVELWGTHVVNQDLAVWLASLLVWHRTSLAAHMTYSERAELERVRILVEDPSLGRKDGMKWILPGDIEKLVAAVAPRFSGGEDLRTLPPLPGHSPTVKLPKADD